MTRPRTERRPHRDRPHAATRRVLIATLVPPVLVVLLVAIYGVDVPYWDTWDWLDRHYPAAPVTSGALARYWELFNDHRMFVPLVIDRVVLAISGGNLLARTWLKIPLSIATLWVTLRLARRTLPDGQPAWLAPALACLAFPLTYWPMWIDPRQFSVHVVALTMLAALGAAIAPWSAWRRVLVSGICCVIASLSHAHGLITWPFVGVLLLVHRPRPHVVSLLTWGICGLLLAASRAMDTLTGASQTHDAMASDAWSLAAATFAMIGLPVAPALRALAYVPTMAAGLCGVLAIAWLGSRAWRGDADTWRRAFPWLLLGGWGVATAAITGWARGGLSPGALNDPRFAIGASSIWTAGVVLLAMEQAGRDTRTSRKRLPSWMVPTLVCVLALSYAGASLRPFFAAGGLGGLSATLASGRACLQSLPTADDACLAQLHPSPARVREITTRLGPERLRLLREAPARPDDPERGEATSRIRAESDATAPSRRRD